MPQIKFPEIEQEILKFWGENKVFEKSVKKPAPKGAAEGTLRPRSEASEPRQRRDFVFYDGPPFATGTPHYGHIVASLMKDVVPRYWTMKGYKVERVWGWDCHGLPIENIVEKELHVQTKKQIEQQVGVDKFNESCRSKVLLYADEWKKFIPRMGRWVDMDRAYKTMDLSYMESIWWVFKQLWDKGLIYENHKSMHICPRCETTLSQSEVSEGYKDVKDLSVVVKFRIKNAEFTTRNVDPSPDLRPSSPLGRGGDDELSTYFLAWTTTPWTLPGNVALAVGEEIDYVMVCEHPLTPTPLPQGEGRVREHYILAKARLPFLGDGYEVIQEIKGKDLIGLAYEPLFPYFDTADNRKKGFKVYAADFVKTEEGTGIVHIAPAFGEDDMNLGKARNLPWVQHVTMDGRFVNEVIDFAGQEVRPVGDSQSTDRLIIKWLKEHGKLFSSEEYLHSYPHCWRCETPLLNYATSSWFVKVSAIKKKMLKLAKKIYWVPDYIKEGRFGKWLEGAEDWSISRQRFWGSVMPIWKCQAGKPKGICDNIKVFGSIEDLEKASGQKITDIHKHIVDKIVFPCDKCGNEMRRIPDVLDCWFESGSMPYAQWHYPFENKEKFEHNFPAQFIAEGVDQTRCWFYYLLVLSTALMNKVPFKNVIANGIVLAEDGQKMSKRLKNYPDPNDVINKYGADALRYYLLTSPVMKAETVNFSEKGVDEAYKKIVLLTLNVLSFYNLYSPQIQNPKSQIPNSKSQTNPKFQIPNSKNILDKWVIARLNETIKEITSAMDSYDLVLASRPIAGFVDDLSTWYLRRSRDRFKSNKKSERKAALATSYYVLATLSKLMAPFMPFLAEHIWQNVMEHGTLNMEQLPSPLPLPEGEGDRRSGEGEINSVHLAEWPKFKNSKIDANLLEQMTLARKIVEMAHSARAEAKIKVRQPLAELRIKNEELRMSGELLKLIADEVNVKNVVPYPNPLPVGEGQGEGQWITKTENDLTISLNTTITPELKKEGLLRELVRHINDARKKAGLTPQDKVVICIKSENDAVASVIKENIKELRRVVLSKSVKIVKKPATDAEWSGEADMGEYGMIFIGIKRDNN